MGNAEIKQRTAELFKMHREATDESTRIFLENDIIELNFNFAMHKTHRYEHITLVDNDDIVASAITGLYLAVRSYDHTKSAFSTYAGIVIQNEINGVFRKAGRAMRTGITPLSLNEAMDRDVMDSDAWLGSDVQSDFVNRELFDELLCICEEILSDAELTVLKNSLLPSEERKTQREIAMLLHNSQSQVGRIQKRAISKLRGHISELEWGLELLRG